MRKQRRGFGAPARFPWPDWVLYQIISLLVVFFFILISRLPNCILVLVYLNAAHVTAIHCLALINQTDTHQNGGREQTVPLNLTPGLSSCTLKFRAIKYFTSAGDWFSTPTLLTAVVNPCTDLPSFYLFHKLFYSSHFLICPHSSNILHRSKSKLTWAPSAIFSLSTSPTLCKSEEPKRRPRSA